MTQTIAVTTVITNLNEAHQRLNLQPTNRADFFTEWQGDLPELRQEEIDTLDRLKARYRYHQADGAITESTVRFYFGLATVRAFKTMLSTLQTAR